MNRLSTVVKFGVFTVLKYWLICTFVLPKTSPMQTFVEINIQASNNLSIRQLSSLEILTLNVASMVHGAANILAAVDGRCPDLNRQSLYRSYKSLRDIGLMCDGWRLTYMGMAYLAYCSREQINPRAAQLCA